MVRGQVSEKRRRHCGALTYTPALDPWLAVKGAVAFCLNVGRDVEQDREIDALIGNQVSISLSREQGSHDTVVRLREKMVDDETGNVKRFIDEDYWVSSDAFVCEVYVDGVCVRKYVCV